MNQLSHSFEHMVTWAKTQGVEIISTTEAEQRWGKCQRIDPPHPYCDCSWRGMPEVHYYANPRESFSLNEAYEECKELGKSIVVVEDLS